jgi:hypothetical protein
MVAAEGLHIDLPGDKPIVVAGRPGAMRVEVPLANRGDTPLVVREARVKGKIPGATATLVALLQPGQSASARLLLRLDARTAPGTYYGEIEIGDATRKLEVVVVENTHLTIDPDPVVLEHGRERVHRKTVLFRNQGNVPLLIHPPARVPLGAELPFAPTATGDVAIGDNIGRALKTLFGKLSEGRETRLLEEDGAMTLRLHDGAFALAPGETRAAQVECTLPAELSPHRRYRASAPIYDADLNFLIVTPQAPTRPPADDTHRPMTPR